MMERELDLAVAAWESAAPWVGWPPFTVETGDVGGYLAETEVTWVGYSIVSAKMTITNKFDLGDASVVCPVYDIQGLLTHELGHVLGLDDQPNSHNGVMRWELPICDVTFREVTKEDVALVRESPPLPSCSASPAGAEAASIVGAIVVLVAAVGIARRFVQ